MKKIIAIFVITLMAAIGMACSFAPSSPPTVTALAEAKLADSLIQSGVVDEAVLSVNLSDAELNTYIAALDTYNSFRAQWQEPTPELYLLLDTQYAQLYQAYRSVKAVVAEHWAEYPLHTQTQLMAYQGYAMAIDAAVSEALAAKNQQQALNNAIQLGILIAKIAAA